MADIGKLWTPEHDPKLFINLTPLKKGAGLRYGWYVWTKPLIHFSIVWEFPREVKCHVERERDLAVLHFTLPFLQAGDGGLTGGSGRLSWKGPERLAIGVVQNNTHTTATGAALVFEAPTTEPIHSILLSGWFLPKDGSGDPAK